MSPEFSQGLRRHILAISPYHFSSRGSGILSIPSIPSIEIFPPPVDCPVSFSPSDAQIHAPPKILFHQTQLRKIINKPRKLQIYIAIRQLITPRLVKLLGIIPSPERDNTC